MYIAQNRNVTHQLLMAIRIHRMFCAQTFSVTIGFVPDVGKEDIGGIVMHPIQLSQVMPLKVAPTDFQSIFLEQF